MKNIARHSGNGKTIFQPSNKAPDGIAYFDQKSEKEIWAEFKSGSEAALVYIYKRFYKVLYNYASQFTQNRELIKDAIHDLFIELMRKRKKLSDTTSIKYYLFKSIKVNLIGKLKRNKKIDLKENLLDGFDFGLSFSIEQVMIDRQIDEEKKLRIDLALKTLTSKQREIIYYYYFESMGLKEISGLMGFTNQKSAQNLLYKSIKTLRCKSLVISTLICFQLLLAR